MKHLDLFSGIGGFALAARWMEWETIGFVEIDKFCQKVLSKNFPNIPIHGDIKTFNGTNLRGTVDILTGGFPCQRYSIAGHKKGNEPLKDETVRVLHEVMPDWAILENVRGFISDEFAGEHDDLCKQVEDMGYYVQTFDIDAGSCGLPTMERHIWIVAQANRIRPQGVIRKTIPREQGISWELSGSYTGKGERWAISESRVCGVGQRIPNRMDRNKSLGNAIPPKVAFELFQAIEDTMNSESNRT
jgi:DNA (cytosine-5)-methyltransferase 1